MASEKQTFKYDIIIAQSTLPPPKEDDTSSEYLYSVRIYKDFVEVPFDRMWTDEFPREPLGEFDSSPCELIGSLTSKGVCVTLNHRNTLMGSATATLAPHLLRQLTDPSFEAIQTFDMELSKQGKGSIVIQLKLKLSSQHPDVDPGDKRLYDVCRPVYPAIHPKDTVFTLGRSCKCPETVCITDNRLMSHAAGPFQCVHAPDTPKGVFSACLTGGAVPPPPPPDQDKRRERSMLKELLEELQVGRERVPQPPANHEAGRRWRCQCRRKEAQSDSDDSDDLSGERFNLSGGYVDVEEDNRRKALGSCPIDEPKLTQISHKAPLFCPLCKSDVYWLPKGAACPYCGYRNYHTCATDHCEELYDESATAQKILDDYVRKEVCESGSEEGEDGGGDKAGSPRSPKPCGCISGRPCTRCRIRKLCQSIFRENDGKVKVPLPVTEEQPKAGSPTKRESKELVKKDSTPSQRRSQLIKIFTEMRNVYDSTKRKSSEVNLLCNDLQKDLEAGKSKMSRARKRALKKALKEIDEAYPRQPKKKRTCKAKRKLISKRYSFLNLHKAEPCARIGHNTCISDSDYTGYSKIPCHMGWNWTKSEMSRFKSWKPGKISKSIRELMSYFLKDFPVDTIAISRYHCPSQKSAAKSEEVEPLVQHPTLHISKKHDEYVITLRPLKEAKALAVCANPYVDMKPVVFRITKDPYAVKLRELRTALKDRGFRPCTCNNPIVCCYCRSQVDKKRLLYALEILCDELNLPDVGEDFIYCEDDDGDSEDEYEFGVTPPAGLIKPDRLWHPDHAHAETQYADHDWALPTMFPHPPNPYLQYGACVMGERKDKFNWIYGKGKVHSKPPKPPQRNKPKKKEKGKKRLAGGYVSQEVIDAFVRNPQEQLSPPPKRMWHKSSSPDQTSLTDVSSYSRIRH